jgi:DNA-binding CsgD family transcriptional regulator
MIEPLSETPKREEQVLVLAAGGLTDKEIAQRLEISPDTVGTYWRRILGKYQANSRTEVVAKYMEERSQQAMQSLEYVNECLALVNEHLIEHGVSTNKRVGEAILASMPYWVLLLNSQGVIIFSNRPVQAGTKMADVVKAPDIREALTFAQQGPVETKWTDRRGRMFEFTLAPGLGAVRNHIIACGRAV